MLAAVLALELFTAPGCGRLLAQVASPTPNADSSALGGVAFAAAGDGWAVGSVLSGTNRTTLRMHWDGSAWSIVPGPDGAGPVNWLIAVSAGARDDVWAVGYTELDSSQAEALIQHWDGVRWSLASVQPVAGRSTRLYGVAAIARDDVWAVGETTSFSDFAALALHWDGSAWTEVRAPSPSPYTRLGAVAALATDDVWAIGWHDDGISHTLAEHWDGSVWSVVPTPDVGFLTNTLVGLGALAPDDVWAVGFHHNGSVNQTEALHWDGSSWSDAQVPSVNLQHNWLFAVAPVCHDDVYAIGFYDTGPPSPTHEVLIEHWDGTAWCRTDGPMPGSYENEVYSAVVAPGGEVWAAGGFASLLGFETLVGRIPAPAVGGGRIGNTLRAVRRGADVLLDWTTGATPARDYNVHRVSDKTAISPPRTPLSRVSAAESYPDLQAAPPAVYHYGVYARDCAGASIPE